MGTYFIQTREPLIWASRNRSFSTWNFPFSYSSLEKAFTTRLPLMFSWTKAFREEKQSRLRWKAGLTSLDCLKVAMAVKGSTTIMHRASFQFTRKIMINAKTNSSMFW